MLTKEQLEVLTKMQREMQERFRCVPDNGKYVEYLGKKFIVYKNVFWPFDDSKPLVENYKVKPGECVLDVCTGSGVIAVFSAYKGAKKVIAFDVSLDAVKTAKANVKLHGFDDIIEVRLSDTFEALHDDELFDVITANLPFRNIVASDQVEGTMWDSGFETNRKFFKNVGNHLRPNGRIYLSQANFGEVEKIKKLADAAGFAVKLIGSKSMPKNDPRVFYAFELTRKFDIPRYFSGT